MLGLTRENNRAILPNLYELLNRPMQLESADECDSPQQPQPELPVEEHVANNSAPSPHRNLLTVKDSDLILEQR